MSHHRFVVRRGVAVAAAILTVGLAMVAWTGSADAGESVEVTVLRTGWWSGRAGSAPAGEGGFEVSTGPDGAVQGIAAFEVDIPAAVVDDAGIVLTEAAALAEFGALKLCTTAEDWEAADPGGLDEAPEPDCTVSVNLTRTLDSRTWLGTITPLAAEGGTTTIMVVPEYTPPTPLGTGMFVRIDGIELTAEGSTTPQSVTTTTLDFTTPGGGNTFEPTPDAGVIDSFGGELSYTGDSPSFDSGGTVTIDDLGTGAPDPAVAPEPIASDDAFFTLGEVEEVPAEPKPWIRLVFLVPLSAAIGYGTIRVKALLEGRTSEVLAI
ncbi:hypothetical protein [Actinospongicola halichondriae]|uniref:hypothetical protein n=1 Tax=Actinospongicola halichondriae TaxID=3236844 RepID=UPI003D5749A5